MLGNVSKCTYVSVVGDSVFEGEFVDGGVVAGLGEL